MYILDQLKKKGYATIAIDEAEDTVLSFAHCGYRYITKELFGYDFELTCYGITVDFSVASTATSTADINAEDFIAAAKDAFKKIQEKIKIITEEELNLYK